MKDYISIIFGDFSNQRKVYDVMLALTPIVESENLKFHYTETTILCHFESNETPQEITTYFTAALYGMVDMFFTVESKDLSYYMNDEMKTHLMDLTESENPNMVIDMDKVRKGEDGLLEQDLINLPIVFDDDDEEDNQIQMIRNQPKKPSLDEILEKIHIYGYDSLSQTEINLLNTYSN